MNIGQMIRVIQVPADLKDDEEMQTRALFEKCVGRVFPVLAIEQPEGLQYRLLRLDVGEVLGEKAWVHTIWIEEQFVEAVAHQQ